MEGAWGTGRGARVLKFPRPPSPAPMIGLNERSTRSHHHRVPRRHPGGYPSVEPLVWARMWSFQRGRRLDWKLKVARGDRRSAGVMGLARAAPDEPLAFSPIDSAEASTAY